ncbi:hypothetical protein D3C76_1721180 [compost metagenome]
MVLQAGAGGDAEILLADKLEAGRQQRFQTQPGQGQGLVVDNALLHFHHIALHAKISVKFALVTKPLQALPAEQNRLAPEGNQRHNRQ